MKRVTKHAAWNFGSVKDAVPSTVFGKRKEPHTFIIARGDEIRHFTMRPWLAAFLGSACAAIAIGYILATSYLVLRDDLIGANNARQARLQQAYEDRISSLRAQVDRITSRQLLDQREMESKVGELLQRQTQLTARHGRLGPVLERAASEQALPGSAPLPPAKPQIRAGLDTPTQEFALAGVSKADEPFSFWATRSSSDPLPSAADKAEQMFSAINESLHSIESDQLTRIDTLAENAYETADAISLVLKEAGLPVDEDHGKDATGGPLVAVGNPALFETKVRELDDALDTLDQMKSEVRRLPIANPAPGRSISSTFGIRKDPLSAVPHFIPAWTSVRRQARRPVARPPARSSRPDGTAAMDGWSRSITAAASPRATRI